MLVAQQKLSASITANTITDIYYLSKKFIQNREEITRALLNLMELLDVVEISGADCIPAFDLNMNDYVDALLAQCAKRSKATYIITRNTKDFKDSPVEAITPADFLNRFFP
jgi:predicted nucleic acid-binding protein